MSLKDKISEATLNDALEWEGEPEKFLFCVDYLEISAHAPNADSLVWALEIRLESLLKERAVI